MDSPLPIPERVKTLIEMDDAEAVVDSPPESLFITGAAIGAGIATRRGLQAAWKRWRGNDPPTNPAAAGVSWSDALIWAVAVAAAVGVARVLSRRTTTAAINRVTS